MNEADRAGRGRAGRRSDRLGLLRSLAARPRLIVSVLVGVLGFPLLPTSLRLTTRVLIAFDAGVLLYIVLAWIMMGRASVGQMRGRAEQQDDGALAILIMAVTAALASLGAIAVELHGIHDAKAEGPELRLLLVGLTILCSWVFVQTMFTLHYAHEYYGGDDGQRCGLSFPKPDRAPDYWDFMYFAFTIGAASQTSDVTVVEHRMRRFVLAHTILSFLFNTTVLALAINVGASLL